MVEENKIKQEKKVEVAEAEKVEAAVKEEKKVSDKKSDKKNEKKVEVGKKKTEAKVEGKSLHFSLKHGVAICDFIRGKKIEKAIADLEEVLKFKKPIPMKGEIPHRKGIMSGRFPVKAVGEVIKLLRSLGSNAIVNELELEKYVIFCKTNVASRPYKRFGQGRMKRCHITLKLVLPVKKVKKKK